MENTAASLVKEFLSFKLGNEEYGIDIQRVQEIRGYDAVTRIPNAPDFMKGVVNLRGVIVPIVDLRIKFNLGNPTYDQFTVTIILNIGDMVVGAVVDSVSDVINLKEDQIRPANGVSSSFDADYLTGFGTIDETDESGEKRDRMLILVDIDKLMSDEEMGIISNAATN